MSHKLNYALNNGLAITDDVIWDWGEAGSKNHGRPLGEIADSVFHYLILGDGQSDSLDCYLLGGDSTAYDYFMNRALEHETKMEELLRKREAIRERMRRSHVEGSEDPGPSTEETKAANQRVAAARRNRKAT